MVYDNILEAVGHTPMIRLRRMAPEGAQVLVKFEGLNVGGSIKTRTALAMIEDAERRGLIRPDTVIVEPTSGNQGVGLALCGAVKGYRVRVIMPDSTILADYALKRLNRLLSNLVVHPDNMMRNMEHSYGLYFSQRVLTALIDSGHPRQESYVAVQKLAMESWQTHTPFPTLVRQDPQMQQVLGADKMDELFDPKFYLRFEDDVYKRVFSQAN